MKRHEADYIPNEVIMVVLKMWSELLLEVSSNNFQKGIIPDRWKRQIRVPLKKEDKPLEDPSLQRPICLLDTMGKLMERMILQRLGTHIEADGGLSKKLFGFRKVRSTVYVITNVVNELRTVNRGPWNKRGYCALVTLDIRNAYAWWGGIMDALSERRTPEYLLRIFDSYLKKFWSTTRRMETKSTK